MKKLSLIVLFVLISISSFAGIIQQDDFTPAQNGTLPSDFTALYDAGVDVIVTQYSNVSGVVADHTGGDGYVLRLGDLGSGGGTYNWGYMTDLSKATTDSSVEVWVNLSFDTVAFPLERDYGVIARCTSGPAQGAGARNGYMFLITSNSSWGSYYPANATPFIVAMVGGSWLKVAEGTTPVSNGWHKLKIKAVGTQITGYVDGVQACTGTDATFSRGVGGLVYYEDNGSAISYPYAAAFDNFIFQTEASDVSDWNSMK
jgi:hypothetical protein